MKIPVDPIDGKPGLRIETAASVVAKDMLHKHLRQFAHVLRTDKHASETTAAVYTSGLSGVLSLAIAGGMGSKNEIVNAAVKLLREYVDRDLSHLRKN